jgi:hypothetical protein
MIKHDYGALLEHEGGGQGAAVSLSEDQLKLDQRRLFLVPAMILLFLLAPLLREGIPATQAGLLPLDPAVARLLTPAAALAPALAGPGGYKLSLVVYLLLAGAAVAALSWLVWGRGTVWWLLSLWLVSPVTIGMLYVYGWAHHLLGVALLALGGIFLLVLPGRGRLLFIPVWGLALLLLWGWHSSPGGIRSLLPGSPLPDTPREWLAGAPNQLSLPLLLLSALSARLAWRRRNRGVLALAACAVTATVLALPGGPLLLLLAVATLALVLLAGALPSFDSRFANVYLLLALVAAASAITYAYLRPPWLVDLPSPPLHAHSFGDQQQVALLDIQENCEGETVSLVAYWQLTRPGARDYTVFVHLLDDQEAMVAQADAPLQDEQGAGTSSWPRGYVVHQRYMTSAPGEVHQARVGLYDPETQQRLLLAAGGDSITVPLSSCEAVR